MKVVILLGHALYSYFINKHDIFNGYSRSFLGLSKKENTYPFPLISTPGTYLILKFLDAALIRGWCLEDSDIYFKAGEMNYMKFQNFGNIFFKTKRKHQT